MDRIVDLCIRWDEHGVRRVDVSLQHHDFTAEGLGVSARNVCGIDPQRALRVFHRLVQAAPARPGFAPIATLSFDARDHGTAVALGLWMPTNSEIGQDADVHRRIEALCSSGLGCDAPFEDAAGMFRAVRSELLATPFGSRCTTDGVAVEISADGERVALDLRLELARSGADAGPLDAFGSRMRVPGAFTLEDVRACEDVSSLTLHPFVVRELREVGDPSSVWLLLDNLWEGVSQHASRRLAGVIARIDDDRIRSLLVRWLDAELGRGDFRGSRRRMLRALLDTTPRVSRTTASRLPGHRLSARIDAIHADDHPFVALGAAVVEPIFMAQLGTFVLSRLRMCGARAAAERLRGVLPTGVDTDSTAILRTLEHDDERRAVARGARAIHAAWWFALDELYRLRVPP